MANLAQMAKNRHAPRRMAILVKMAILSKMANLVQLAKKSPKGYRYPECGKYSNWMPKVAPSNYITKEVPITVRQHFSKKFQVR